MLIKKIREHIIALTVYRLFVWLRIIKYFPVVQKWSVFDQKERKRIQDEIDKAMTNKDGMQKLRFSDSN